MAIEDYAEIYDLWNSTPGIGLGDADSRQSVARFLERNPKLSFVFRRDQKILGTILCGHDGRRGYTYHTCVLSEYRGQGIGSLLAGRALEALRSQGLEKCHLFAFKNNEIAGIFWKRLGWEQRLDILTYSKNIK
jgi:ribosomal protein S18 acetylase RimI-like enzyme